MFYIRSSNIFHTAVLDFFNINLPLLLLV